MEEGCGTCLGMVGVYVFWSSAEAVYMAGDWLRWSANSLENSLCGDISFCSIYMPVGKVVLEAWLW
jgi:hypothetical protein